VNISTKTLQDIVVLDIETEQISSEMFRRQKKKQDVFSVLPSPRVCVTYDSLTQEHHVYMPDSFDQLYQVVQSRAILTFNGIHFDLPVILKHLGLAPDSFASKTNHFDLLAEINNRTGQMYNLDNLAFLNLGQHKHTDGRQMKDMDILQLTEACQSDVDQTYALAKMFCENTLRYPVRSKTSSWDDDDDDDNNYGWTITNGEVIQAWLKINKSQIELEEAIANGHKYGEYDKIGALDAFLIEKSGQTYASLVDICFADDSEQSLRHHLLALDFNGRCDVVLPFLLSYRVRMPFEQMDMTEGQWIDYMTENNMW